MIVLMACDSKPVATRRLCDVLEEEQEPCMLDVATFQHNHSSKSKDFCNNGRRTWLSSPISNKEQEKKRRMSHQSAVCSRTLKYMLDQFAFPCKIHGTQTLHIKGHQEVKKRHSVRQCGGMSSCRISRYFDPFCKRDMTDHYSVSSCSDPIKALNLSDTVTEKEVKEDNAQVSHMSVREIPIGETFPTDNFKSEGHRQSDVSLKLLCRVADDSWFFWSLWEQVVQAIKQKQGLKDSKLQETFGYYSLSQCFKTKQLVCNSRQLLFDYVKEVAKTAARSGRISAWTCWQCMFQQQLGPQQHVKSTCQQICSWGRSADDIQEASKLIESDLSRNEFSHLSKHETYRVVRKIEAAIISGIIDEIVSDLLCLPT
ncbi:uncharacterized protein LOC116252386 [Nymphaea colorata]|nr:uncharacterized protein LOC116252386 [Nymphaea colorata]